MLTKFSYLAGGFCEEYQVHNGYVDDSKEPGGADRQPVASQSAGTTVRKHTGQPGAQPVRPRAATGLQPGHFATDIAVPGPGHATA